MPSFIEFVVLGVPVSCQSQNPGRVAHYRKQLADAAAPLMEGVTPASLPVRLDIRFFTIPGILPDPDNAAKLIQDALQGVAYVNDRLADDGTHMRRDVNEPIVVAGVPELLASTLSQAQPFTYVRVTFEVDRTVIW